MPTTSKTSPVTALRKRLEKRKKEIDFEVQSIFESQMRFIIKKQQEQLYSGERADGTEIKPDYTPTTKRIKRGKGQPTDRVTLRDTGDFYNAMDVDFTTKDFQITNFDSKFSMLEKKYGDEILGLTTESKAELKLRVQDKLNKFLKQKLL